MSAPVAIEVRDLRKSFAIPLERHSTLKERSMHPGSWLRSENRTLEALRGISFEVGRGEFFGVIGRNGCGKSTLLKLLASIYRVDGGSIRVAGRLAPFIELGVGFNPELPARENVVLNGVMMGLSPAEARARFDAVIDYAELWDYTDLKLKNYSSGMHVRLAFSLMLQVDADVLLVDEVLAVGDVAFQEKCNDSLDAMQRQGTTVVLVTHDMDAIKTHCERAMLIEDGRIDLIGDATEVTDRYIEVIFAPDEADPEAAQATEGAVVESAWISDRDGAPAPQVPVGEPLAVNFTIRAHEPVREPLLLVELINNPEGLRISGFEVGAKGEIPSLAAGERTTVRVMLEDNRLLPGNYRFSYALATAAPEKRILDRCRAPVRLKVSGHSPDSGMVGLGPRISVEGVVAGSRR